MKKKVKKNTKATPKKVILDQLNEPRPLPMGRTEFEEFFERIKSGANIPGLTDDSYRFVLADRIMHLTATDSHMCDGYFIKALRKYAANQVCHAVLWELQEAKKKRALEEAKAAEAAEKLAEQAEYDEAPACEAMGT